MRKSLYRWASVRSKFKLIVDGVKTEAPDDIAYVTSGYAPLSARVVQMAMDGEWKRNAELLRLLPGPQLECAQKGAHVAPRRSNKDENSAEQQSAESAGHSHSSRSAGGNGAKKTMLVYVI